MLWLVRILNIKRFLNRHEKRKNGTNLTRRVQSKIHGR